jgi:replicative DNA helicase
MSQQIVDAYLSIRGKIKEQARVLAELRQHEKELMKELRDYLNQSESTGIRIDDSSVITITSNDKKINRSKKAYKKYLLDLIESKGMYNGKSLVDEILAAKVENIVQQQRLKIIKTK